MYSFMTSHSLIRKQCYVIAHTIKDKSLLESNFLKVTSSDKSIDTPTLYEDNRFLKFLDFEKHQAIKDTIADRKKKQKGFDLKKLISLLAFKYYSNYNYYCKNTQKKTKKCTKQYVKIKIL
ncbi:hypothetical protein RFI_21583 [Reticulomyxa filosa]|uniref:Uncharacterized protein n=1 Tax=Reticulomyxa filosa TaxID=46433 RepID=X6MRQ5_RETFI|nr:hypothetical protein RFI_21583 [Reticulomyxa filosa]|eukprot:ETO15780.1 hypothetical protein RFI_21583 [Reticulomyxa filosa]